MFFRAGYGRSSRRLLFAWCLDLLQIADAIGTVENQYQCAVFIRHGLMSLVAEVDEAKVAIA